MIAVWIERHSIGLVGDAGPRRYMGGDPVARYDLRVGGCRIVDELSGLPSHRNDPHRHDETHNEDRYARGGSPAKLEQGSATGRLAEQDYQPGEPFRGKNRQQRPERCQVTRKEHLWSTNNQKVER